MSIFDDFRLLAVNLLREMGAQATLTRQVQTYNPETRETSTSTSVHSCRGVLKPAGGDGGGERAVESAKQSYRTAIISDLPFGVTPQIDDLLTIGSVTARINGMTPIQPDGGNAIVWQLALGDA